jgi:hypothetical protein
MKELIPALSTVRRLRPGGFRQQLLSYTLVLILFVMAAALVFFSLTFTMFEQVQEQTNVYITINELTAGLMESRAAFDEIITRQPSAGAAGAPPGYTARRGIGGKSRRMGKRTETVGSRKRHTATPFAEKK